MSIEQKKESYNRVEELKNKINDEKYLRDVISKMASEIIDIFFISPTFNREA